MNSNCFVVFFFFSSILVMAVQISIITSKAGKSTVLKAIVFPRL